MNPDDMKLPKMDRASFQIAQAASQFTFPFPYSIVAHADPAWILDSLEPGDTRQVIAAYARFQAASAKAAVDLYTSIGNIAQGSTGG